VTSQLVPDKIPENQWPREQVQVMPQSFIISLGILALLALPSRAQSRKPAPRLTAAVDELVKIHGITNETPGVAILVTHRGQVLFQKGYGSSKIT
jgi:CubicO group peptidase (beta-lactamase class C family)